MSGEAEFYDLQVNGTTHAVRDAWLGESLLYVLRERLGLPGTKGACEQGECGSCTVLIDGDAICACLVMAADAVDAQVTTVEGFTTSTGLTDVQASFLAAGGVQCGFCTPGLVVAVHHLLDTNPDPSDNEVREAISGNICRCTGYGRIFEAVRTARAERVAVRTRGQK